MEKRCWDQGLAETLLGRFGLSLNEEGLVSFDEKVYYWAKKMDSRWQRSSRNVNTFQRKHVQWLKGDIVLVERHPNVGGRPKKPFVQLSNRNKKRAVQKWMNEVAVLQLEYAA